MGKKSIKENKNIYQLNREAAGLTRDKASEQMVYISADRIEKIESEKSFPHPDEILAMSKCYKTPDLCNYFCSHECPIGQEHIPEVRVKTLSQTVLELLASLNDMERERNRLIEITVDGEISQDEYEDFAALQKKLKKISVSIESMRLWVEKTIADGKLDKNWNI